MNLDNDTYRIENTPGYAFERSWCVALCKDANEVALGFDEEPPNHLRPFPIQFSHRRHFRQKKSAPQKYSLHPYSTPSNGQIVTVVGRRRIHHLHFPCLAEQEFRKLYLIRLGS